MPFKYAIKAKTDRVIGRSPYGEKIYETEYHLAPKDYVETHVDGVKCLVSTTGEPLTNWMPVKRMEFDLTSIIKGSQAPAVKDFMGTELKVGDYVVVHHQKRKVELQICKVIGFVKQGKARMLPVDDFEQSHGILKFPSEMVKVPEHVLGEDPTSEWIPSEEEII